MPDNAPLTPSELGRRLALIPSDARTAARRENIKKATAASSHPGRPQKALDDFPCTCPDPPPHKALCPRGRALKRRALSVTNENATG